MVVNANFKRKSTIFYACVLRTHKASLLHAHSQKILKQKETDDSWYIHNVKSVKFSGKTLIDNEEKLKNFEINILKWINFMINASSVGFFRMFM